MSKNHSQWQRITFAWGGLSSAWKREASFRTEVVVAAAVMLWMTTQGFPLTTWVWVASATALVLICELFNTSIETLCDAVHPERGPLIKIAKDCGSAAVLLANMYAFIIFLRVIYESHS